MYLVQVLCHSPVENAEKCITFRELCQEVQTLPSTALLIVALSACILCYVMPFLSFVAVKAIDIDMPSMQCMGKELVVVHEKEWPGASCHSSCDGEGET